MAMRVAAGSGSDDAFRLQQYNKIVQLKDIILAGEHPHVRPPAHVPSSTVNNVHASADAQTESSRNLSAVSHYPSVSLPGLGQGLPQKAAVQAAGQQMPQINPIFLEKSDDLVRAELQIQRQRLERAIKDEVEQRRLTKSTQAEPTADFDLSSVLAQAVALVHSAAGPLPAPEESNANDAASDSFDDNTFYSSQHDTPESNLASRVRDASVTSPIAGLHVGRTEDAAVGSLGAMQARTESQTVHAARARPDVVSLIPGLVSHADIGEPKVGRGNTSGTPSQSGESARLEAYPYNPTPMQALTYHYEAYADAHPPSPLLRSPAPTTSAPQPFRPTRALAGINQQTNPTPVTAPPAQVAILRNEPARGTSPESSPQGVKSSEKKRGKKKKRKAERQVPDADATPYIKPEPRSVSPVSAPAYLRPSKRPKHTQRPEPDVYEVPGFDPVAPNGLQAQRAEPAYLEERTAAGYGPSRPFSSRAASTSMLTDAGHAREYQTERAMPGEVYVRRQPSPTRSALNYIPGDARIERPTSRIVMHDPYAESVRAYHEPYEPYRAPRLSVRPEPEYYMAPPRPQPTRIYVDASGREYIEPPRPSVRQSLAPTHPESDIVYERAPPRAISRHPAPGSYEESGVVYAPSPSYMMPRRVVTQPEPGSYENREYRQREFSTRPVPPAGEYVEVMGPPTRRAQPMEEGIRRYSDRAASTRPLEPIRYEAAPDYRRMQSVRPEAPLREYAGSVAPEGRRDYVQPYASTHYAEPAPEYVEARRGYSVRPVERYQEQPPQGGGNVTYVERPPAGAQEVVYADPARREVYR